MLAAFVAAFGAVFLLELPDKTTALTLVLSTRYRSRAVLVGAALAFLLQSAIAVGLGSAITLLPTRVVAGAVALLFTIGAVLLIRESLESEEAAPTSAAKGAAVPFGRSAGASFVLLFTAEWGDASQVTAVGVAAHYDHPVTVGTGAFSALMCVTLLALMVGKRLRDRVPAHFIQRAAAVVFAVFAAIAAYAAVLG